MATVETEARTNKGWRLFVTEGNLGKWFHISEDLEKIVWDRGVISLEASRVRKNVTDDVFRDMYATVSGWRDKRRREHRIAMAHAKGDYAFNR